VRSGDEPGSSTGDDESQAGQARLGGGAQPGGGGRGGRDGSEHGAKALRESRQLRVGTDVGLSRAQHVT
jgi:hypothetical protein